VFLQTTVYYLACTLPFSVSMASFVSPSRTIPSYLAGPANIEYRTLNSEYEPQNNVNTIDAKTYFTLPPAQSDSNSRARRKKVSVTAPIIFPCVRDLRIGSRFNVFLAMFVILDEYSYCFHVYEVLSDSISICLCRHWLLIRVI